MSTPTVFNTYTEQLSWTYIVPIILLLVSLGILWQNYAATGSIVDKDLTLQGGVSLTALNPDVDADTVETTLQENFAETDVTVRSLTELGTQTGVIVQADILPEEEQRLNAFIDATSTATSTQRSDVSVDTVGASLGQQFFTQTAKALWVAFLFMGAAVFYYFGPTTTKKTGVGLTTLFTAGLILSSNAVTLLFAGAALTAGLVYTYIRYSIPSAAVILAALSDIIMTLAVLDLLGFKVGTASIAGLLMIIGYSVDTDILLSTRILKETGNYLENFYDAFKTGTTMTLTTLSAVTTTYIFAQSTTLQQIMIVIMIGLVIDLVNTWMQNASILHLYTEGDRQ